MTDDASRPDPDHESVQGGMGAGLGSHEPVAREGKGGLLDLVEKIGNLLPDPATLFLLGTIIVMLVSSVATRGGWSVTESRPRLVTETVQEDGEEIERAVIGEDGKPVVEWYETGEVLESRDLVSREGIFWLLENLVDNFMAFAPLGVVLVGMLGIGIAERTGFIPAVLKAFMLVVPGKLLTPSMVFIGIMSSMTLDAGYVILPPLAAALYLAVGRSPLVGLAAVFAGVAAGFNANLFITGLEPMLAELAMTGTRVIDEDYQVSPTCNWFFMIASTFVITLSGWWITSRFVEGRMSSKTPEEGGPKQPSAEELAEQQLKPEEIRGMKVGGLTFAGVFAVILVLIVVPGMPLFDFKMPDPTDPSRTTIAGIVELEPGAVSSGPAWIRGGYEGAALADWTDGERRIVAVRDDGVAFLVTGPEDEDGASGDDAGDEQAADDDAAADAAETADAAEGDAADEATPEAARDEEAASDEEEDEPSAAAQAIADDPGARELGPVEDLTVLQAEGGFARWVTAIVPLLFFQFIVPAIIYGVSAGNVRNDRDVAKLMLESMAAMAPIIVLAFFAAQFIEAFRWSGLDRMLAMAGGQLLGTADMPTWMLIVAFILMTGFFNLFIGSMSAKYAMFAPIFIPMFMMVGISPELTQTAYRIGDSVTNIITPLNAYLVIILVFMQKYVPKGGMGTLISLMLPYSIGFGIIWTIFLLAWYFLGIPLGPGGPLEYVPAG